MMTSQKRPKPVLKDVPDPVKNIATGQIYKRGKFLGKGGFARCYELIDMESQQIYAGKVVSKLLLVKKHQRDKAINILIFFIILKKIQDDPRSSNPSNSFPSACRQDGRLF